MQQENWWRLVLLQRETILSIGTQLVTIKPNAHWMNKLDCFAYPVRARGSVIVSDNRGCLNLMTQFHLSLHYSCNALLDKTQVLRSLAPSIFTFKCAHFCGEYIFCWAMQNGRLCLIASNMAAPWRKAIWWNMQKGLWEDWMADFKVPNPLGIKYSVTCTDFPYSNPIQSGRYNIIIWEIAMK